MAGYDGPQPTYGFCLPIVCQSRRTLSPPLRTLGGPDLTGADAAQGKWIDLPADDVITRDQRKMPSSIYMFHLNSSSERCSSSRRLVLLALPLISSSVPYYPVIVEHDMFFI